MKCFSIIWNGNQSSEIQFRTASRLKKNPVRESKKSNHRAAGAIYRGGGNWSDVSFQWVNVSFTFTGWLQIGGKVVNGLRI